MLLCAVMLMCSVFTMAFAAETNDYYTGVFKGTKTVASFGNYNRTHPLSINMGTKGNVAALTTSSLRINGDRRTGYTAMASGVGKNVKIDDVYYEITWSATDSSNTSAFRGCSTADGTLSGNYTYTITRTGGLANINGTLTSDDGRFRMTFNGTSKEKVTGKTVNDGKTYFRDENGNLQTGWVKDGDDWYYFNGNGGAKTGWYKENNKWYYLSKNGKMARYRKKIDGKWYYFYGSGEMAHDKWITFGDGKTVYCTKDGSFATGPQTINGKKYLFKYADGTMIKYTYHSGNGKWYYYYGSGEMAQNKWITFKDGKTVYCTSDGSFATGWNKIGGKWYLFKYADGTMIKYWYKAGNGNLYYFYGSGEMHTGWLKSDGKWYYFDTNGVMLKNTSRKIGSKTYQFNNSGVCTNP